MASIKRTENAGYDVEIFRRFMLCWWGCKMMQVILRNTVSAFLENTESIPLKQSSPYTAR